MTHEALSDFAILQIDGLKNAIIAHFPCDVWDYHDCDQRHVWAAECGKGGPDNWEKREDFDSELAAWLWLFRVSLGGYA